MGKEVDSAVPVGQQKFAGQRISRNFGENAPVPEAEKLYFQRDMRHIDAHAGKPRGDDCGQQQPGPVFAASQSIGRQRQNREDNCKPVY